MYKGRETFKTSLGGFCTILARVIILAFLVFEIRKIAVRKYSVARQLDTVNVLLYPDNFTMDSSNFQMAARINFSQSNEDINRYFKIIYGTEYYTWAGTGFDIRINNTLGVPCTREYFTATDEQWDTFSLGKSMCPDILG